MSRKGTIYAGCSFTWGQGLWMYHEGDEHIPSSEEYTKDDMRIPEAAFNLRRTLGWPQIVSNHLNTDPIVKRYNGGSDEESLKFIELVFGDKPHHRAILKDNYSLDEVDIIILQLTQPYRSGYYFEYKDKRYMVKGTPNLRNLDHVCEVAGFGEELWTPMGHLVIKKENLPMDIFLDYLVENNKTIDDFKNEHISYWTNEVYKSLKKYYDLGKKVFLLTWTDEYLDFIKENDFLNKRLITFVYNGKHYDCIEHLQINEDKDGQRMYIETENYNQQRNTGWDSHPSKLCHEIIADNVIKKISNEHLHRFI